MRTLIVLAAFLVGLSAMTSCNSAPEKDDAFYSMVDENWETMKTNIIDSLDAACKDRTKNDMKSAIDSVLKARGIK